MKKQLIILCLLVGCFTKSYCQTNKFADDDTVTQLALNQFSYLKKFRLLETTDDSIIRGYLNGFLNDSINLQSTKFYFKKQRTKWAVKELIWDKQTIDKLIIIPDFDSEPKVLLTETDKAESYISMSNPIYSANKEYALININIFSNFVTNDNADGYVLVFRKSGTKWVYVTKFIGYLT